MGRPVNRVMTVAAVGVLGLFGCTATTSSPPPPPYVRKFAEVGVSIGQTGPPHAAHIPHRRQAGDLMRTRMGLFDGIKEAWTQDDFMAIEEDRETPFDRWLGIETKRANVVTGERFVDSMKDYNYHAISLPKPMGIVFE